MVPYQNVKFPSISLYTAPTKQLQANNAAMPNTAKLTAPSPALRGTLPDFLVVDDPVPEGEAADDDDEVLLG